MKNFLFTVGIFLFFDSTFAQTNLLDKQLKNVNKSSVTSGIIYDRVTPLADLCVFNMPTEKPHNTADFRFFKQALFELHKASNQQKLSSIIDLENKISRYKEMNVVPIGIINTPFQILNYNPINPNEGGLIMKDSLFSQIPGKEPFLNGYAMIISPLKNVMQGEKIIYKFSEDLIFNNGTTSIKSLIADFGDGINHKIIENGILIKNEIIKDNFTNNGDKKLKFIVELSNNFTFNTNGTIYTVFGNLENRSFNTQPIACSNNLQNSNNLIENFKLDYVEASETFQGLNESIALKGKIEARVFYHTNNGNSQKTMLKPIIIVDGFDPSDGRKIDDCDCERDPVCQEAKKDKTTGIYNPDNHTSLVELMKYKDQNNDPQNIISVLRTKGYDVILVNFPTYTTAGVTVDGGADYIQRNAMAMVQLMKEVNTKLQTNGSTEKTVIMGPSMGGQITRYALAYMEKKFAETGITSWKHNSRIWVAFDSPNLGANVPIGAQALIKMLASAENSAEAAKSLNELQSVAANEMLINYSKTSPGVDNQISNYNNFDVNLENNYTNGSTTSQGMASNEGNLYFQEHYNKQFNNGLPNSHGFPMNLRKLAIVNGSLSGETFGNGYEKTLDIRLFKEVCLINWDIWGWEIRDCYTDHLFQAETYSMPTNNNTVAYTEKYGLFGNNHHTIKSFANSIRGNLDNVPGGSIDATGILHSSITGQPAPGSRSFWQYSAASISSFFYSHIGNTPEWETRTLKPDQCFIPTFSSIGMKNPNQNWANPLNRNLVCDPNNKEIYFDSYFGEANNTEHVKLNYRMVSWLLKELGDNVNPPTPQAPYFPIPQNALAGPDIVCINNQNTTFSFGDICKVPSVVSNWQVTPNLQIISSNGFNLVVKGISSGQGKITATFSNGLKFEKDIWVGMPASFNSSASISGPTTVYTGGLHQYSYTGGLPQGATSFEWRLPYPYETVPVFDYFGQNWQKLEGSDGNGIMAFTGYAGNNGYVQVMGKNQCGCGYAKSLYVKHRTNGSGGHSGGGIPRMANPNKEEPIVSNNLTKIFPNPATDIVNIEFNQNNTTDAITGELFDLLGKSILKVEIIDNKGSFSVAGLNKGLYILRIYGNEEIESQKIIVE